MKFRNQAALFGRQYRDEAGAEGGDAGEGTGEGAGAGDTGAAPELPPEVQQRLAAAEKLAAENERLQAKINEANKHAKAAERQAAEEARRKAEAEGNYQQLFESSEKERDSWMQKYTDLENTVHQKEVNQTALKIAGELAEGANIEILSEFLAKRLKFAEDGVKVTDESGNLTVSTLDDLKREFSGSARFASLIKGNQASGGGASGGDSGGSTAKEVSRTDFDRMAPAQQMNFIKKGGVVVD